MKRVEALRRDPPALAAHRTRCPNDTWDAFKSATQDKTVMEALGVAQGWLCAYCEMPIHESLRQQVEHFEPKSSTGRHLDFANLLACCEGGTVPYLTDRNDPPFEARCGAKKGEQSPAGESLDPRTLPPLHSLWKVDGSGWMSPDPARCTTAGVDPALAKRTLDFLGMNSPFLVKHRRALLKRLNVFAGGRPGADALRGVAEPRLLPIEGRFERFWSTTRAWAGASVDGFVAANQRAIFELEPS